jgi:Tol biopolymer transport system component
VRFSVSAEGNRLAYRHQLPDKSQQYRIVDLDTGQQVAGIAQPRVGHDWPPVLSRKGDELAYTARGIYRVSPPGEPERISRHVGDRIVSWSPDGKQLLLQRWHGLGLLNTGTGDDRDLLRDDRWPIFEARFSPDAKWVAFTRASRPHSQIFLAPLDSPESRTEVTDVELSASAPAWSADGSRLYFVKQCQGFRCIWVRRLDARRKQPQGDAAPVRHFHHARYSLLNSVDPQNGGLAVARDKLVFGVFETTGNIWSLASLPKP